MWEYTGRKRPPFADAPGPGQESVWDYPRPPKLVPDKRHIVVQSAGLIIADSRESFRILETAGPPTFYLAPKDVRSDLLKPFRGASVCEWKGRAKYWTLITSAPPHQAVGWSYPTAQPPYELIAGYFSFYPGRIECFVDVLWRLGDRRDCRPVEGLYRDGELVTRAPVCVS